VDEVGSVPLRAVDHEVVLAVGVEAMGLAGPDAAKLVAGLPVGLLDHS
jgi:hypothetical protein